MGVVESRPLTRSLVATTDSQSIVATNWIEQMHNICNLREENFSPTSQCLFVELHDERHIWSGRHPELHAIVWNMRQHSAKHDMNMYMCISRTENPGHPYAMGVVIPLCEVASSLGAECAGSTIDVDFFNGVSTSIMPNSESAQLVGQQLNVELTHTLNYWKAAKVKLKRCKVIGKMLTYLWPKIEQLKWFRAFGRQPRADLHEWVAGVGRLLQACNVLIGAESSHRATCFVFGDASTVHAARFVMQTLVVIASAKSTEEFAAQLEHLVIALSASMINHPCPPRAVFE